MLARNLLRFLGPHFARRYAAGLTQALDPVDDSTDPHSELLRRPIARHAAALNRSNHPFAKVHRVRLAHPMLASFPASMVNQISPDLGIPNRFSLNASRFSHSLARGDDLLDHRLARPCPQRLAERRRHHLLAVKQVLVTPKAAWMSSRPCVQRVYIRRQTGSGGPWLRFCVIGGPPPASMTQNLPTALL